MLHHMGKALCQLSTGSIRHVSNYHYNTHTEHVLTCVFRENRPGTALVIKDFEKKISDFYGIDLMMTTLACDAWICENDRELDNVVITFEPKDVRTSKLP